MDQEIKALITSLEAHAKYEVLDWLADSANAHSPELQPQNHIAWEAATMLRAIFDPENQPSQYGTKLIARGAP